MNPEAYLEMAETESRHWWFTGRRAILSSMISDMGLPLNPRILEVGCGTGGNLEILNKFGSVSAFEMDATARAIASERAGNYCDIKEGHCPDMIPFQDQRFDLICMFDVLEHIEQDTETLIAVKQILKKDGRVLITVPAYQWLFGPHDAFLHHKRRYSAKQLRKIFGAAGFKSAKISYFNSILFPLAVIVRIKDRFLGNPSATGTGVPVNTVNNFLSFLFGAERFLLKHFNLPYGVSLLCILEASNER